MNTEITQFGALTTDNPLTIDTGKNPDVKLGGELQQSTTIPVLGGTGMVNTVITGSQFPRGDNTWSTSSLNPWQLPVLINTIITEDGVEQIFRQESSITMTSNIYPYFSPPPRIYKNVYRIVEGKLKLTETIEGRYLPAKDESYEFEVEVRNPTSPEILARMQDERQGTHTTITNMTREEIKEKYDVDIPDDRYFTPPIEDIHVGYECESLNALPKEERYWIPYVVGETTGTWNQFGGIRWAVENKHLRVPYLTKEQIEKEGWEIDFSRHVQPGFAYHKNGFQLWFNMYGNWIRIEKDHNLKHFYGECKDINTFRYICKLLGI